MVDTTAIRSYILVYIDNGNTAQSVINGFNSIISETNVTENDVIKGKKFIGSDYQIKTGNLQPQSSYGSIVYFNSTYSWVGGTTTGAINGICNFGWTSPRIMENEAYFKNNVCVKSGTFNVYISHSKFNADTTTLTISIKRSSDSSIINLPIETVSTQTFYAGDEIITPNLSPKSYGLGFSQV